MAAQKQQQKTVTEIIAGALQLFQTGPRGGKLSKASRWNNHTLVKKDGAGEGIDTYCALGALAKVANGDANATRGAEFTAAANLVASCVPASIRRREYVRSGMDIPSWNDSLTQKRGFTSIKRVFCKALKLSMQPKPRKRGRKRAA